MSEETGRRGLLVSKAWIQVTVVVFLVGFLILGILAYRSYSGRPTDPKPGRRRSRGGPCTPATTSAPAKRSSSRTG